MKKFTAFLILILLTVIKIYSQETYKLSSKEFRTKYTEFLGPREKVISTWYHYVTSQESSGRYIIRRFFPETKQITAEIRYRDKKFRVIDGQARKWHENGFLSWEGRYENGSEEGEWKYYHRLNGKLRLIGVFESGLKEGVWTEFDNEGRLKSEVTYYEDIKEGVFMEYDSLQNVINRGVYRSDTIFEQTKEGPLNQPFRSESDDQMPYLAECNYIETISNRHVCSRNTLVNYINNNIKYPRLAVENEIQGTAIVNFMIGADGKVRDVDVVIGLCRDIKKECERLVSNLPLWEPGIQRGEKVDVLFTLPIKFAIK